MMLADNATGKSQDSGDFKWLFCSFLLLFHCCLSLKKVDSQMLKTDAIQLFKQTQSLL